MRSTCPRKRNLLADHSRFSIALARTSAILTPLLELNSQFFVAAQENLWSYWGSDPARIAGIYTQQFHGLANQYGALDASYNEDPNTTNGTHQATLTSTNESTVSFRPSF